MRVADFFCGGGGFSEGFRQAGYDIVFAVDRWEPAVTTYKGNKPGVNVIQDDVIRISFLPDEEFEALVPDSEVIIGSPPCKSFSHSNKSGNADKTLGIQLIEAYFRIIARKKFKKNSVLKYWVLENVPSVKHYIKSQYSAKDLKLNGEFILLTQEGSSGTYNAKYFGAPTNRIRYLCGEFPSPMPIKTDTTVVTLKNVLDALGDPLAKDNNFIKDINYHGLKLRRNDVSDHNYIYKLAPFEVETAKRLKQDKGYMGRMDFPENLNRPSRTVMATMSTSSRESMILGYMDNEYRLPTVREAATLMSFPIDYRFYGKSKGIKHTLIGNAVPPKMSYALAKAIAIDAGVSIPKHYIKIHHDDTIEFHNLNGDTFPSKIERPRRDVAKFKYHIPYLIIDAYRVELTNYHSDFKRRIFRWDVEIHYSQGRKNAKKFSPSISKSVIPNYYQQMVDEYIENTTKKICTFNRLQEAFCLTSAMRKAKRLMGPYELLAEIKSFIVNLMPKEQMVMMVDTFCKPTKLPQSIVIGYYILNSLVKFMRGRDHGCSNS